MNNPVFETDLNYNLLPVRMQMEQILKTVNLRNNQLCFTHTKDCKQDHLYQGCGSLHYNIDLQSGEKSVKWGRREHEFTMFNADYIDTPVYNLYEHLSKLFNIGRFRLMVTQPKQCYTWHKDETKRLHVPLVTNPGARMVIGDTAYHLQAGKLYITDTTLPHTAFNGSMHDRYHLVGVML